MLTLSKMSSEKVKNIVATESAPNKVVKFLLAIMTSSGIVYDAYTMDRWTDPERTDLMMQQSAWKSGEPWNKLTDMGTNMRQVVSGPDGNPGGVFSGNIIYRKDLSNTSTCQ